MQAISIKPGDDVNSVVDQHIRAGCPTASVKSKKNSCSFKGCREKEFIPISCKLCKQPFCLKHRFETDHNCAAKKSGTATAAAHAQAAEAAAARQRQQQQQQQQQKEREKKQQQQARDQQQQPRPTTSGASRGTTDPFSQAAAGAWNAATTTPFSPFSGLSSPQQQSSQRGQPAGGARGGGGGGKGGKR